MAATGVKRIHHSDSRLSKRGMRLTWSSCTINSGTIALASASAMPVLIPNCSAEAFAAVITILP
jgi:hypothetical protein